MHTAHVVVAAEVRDRLDLDRVLLVVAGDPWQKRGRVIASAADRPALARCAVDGLDGLEVSTVEVDRAGASVTADTLEALQAPDRTLFLVLGADAVANMGTWPASTTPSTWPRSWWSSAPATSRCTRRGRGGGSTTWPCPASTSRRPTSGAALPPDADRRTGAPGRRGGNHPAGPLHWQ